MTPLRLALALLLSATAADERCDEFARWSVDDLARARLAMAAADAAAGPAAPPCVNGSTGPVALAPGGVDGLGAELARTLTAMLAAAADGRPSACASTARTSTSTN